MAEQETMPPTRADDRNRDMGKWLIGSGVMIAGLLVIIAGLGLTVFRQVHIIDALVAGVSQQRDQFQACRGKPSTTAGCATPVAAEPSVIVKQGSRGVPGIAGAAGQQGPQGPAGPQGPVGPQGPAGPIGKTGPPPGCALLQTACVGAPGPTGPKGDQGSPGPAGAQGPRGETGPKGEQGEPGAQGPAGTQGPQGEMGVQGNPGRGITSTKCVNGAWVITYSDGTQEDPQGSCVAVGP